MSERVLYLECISIYFILVLASISILAFLKLHLIYFIAYYIFKDDFNNYIYIWSDYIYYTYYLYVYIHTHFKINLFYCINSYFIHKVIHVKSLCVIINLYIIYTHMNEMLHIIYLELIWHKSFNRDITLYVYYNMNSVHLYIVFLSHLYLKP